MTAVVDVVADELDDHGVASKGYQLGDWLDPSAPPDNPAGGRTDSFLVAQAYYCRVARIVADAADVLDRPDDAARYRELGDAAAAAFRREFATPSGRLASDSPTAFALALQFDLLADTAQRERAGARLGQLVQADKHHIGTGFLGTPIVLDALVDAGHLDDAYLLLLQDECPSWLYQVRMGATTVWERWDSMLPDGTINPGEMTSFNHYAFGAVGDFLHRRVAGLAPGTPGGRHHHIEPRPGGGLTSAEATLETPYGRVVRRLAPRGPNAAPPGGPPPEGDGHRGPPRRLDSRARRRPPRAAGRLPTRRRGSGSGGTHSEKSWPWPRSTATRREDPWRTRTVSATVPSGRHRRTHEHGRPADPLRGRCRRP